jgi:2-phospho-L-lactate guanylyltransferase
MSCWAIVAIKSRVQCKRRLAAVLEPPERIDLVRRMLDHVLAVAAGAGEVDRVLVVSPERDVLPDSIAVEADEGVGLNEALELARKRARSSGALEIVVLPADLPRLASDDVAALIDSGRSSGVAVAPDRAYSGTNGLYLASTADLAFRFGRRSLEAHIAGARAFGFDPAIVQRAGFEFDIDTPADLLTSAVRPSPRPTGWRWSYSSAGR